MRIDLDELNPDWKFAQNHGKSTIPGRVPAFTQQGIQPNQLICNCCLNVIETQPEPICNHIKELNFLGTGFPVFYMFLKYCIILLLLTIVSYSALSLYKAIDYNEEPCAVQEAKEDDHRLLAAESGTFHCTTWMIKFSRTQNVVTTEETMIRIFSFIIHLCFMVYMRDTIIKTIEYFDERTCTLSDYALKIKGIPMQDGIRKKLVNFCQRAFSEPFQIKQLTLMPEASDYEELENKKRSLISEKGKQLKKKKNSDATKFGEIEREITETETEIEEKLAEYKISAEKDKMQSSKCILIFEKQSQKLAIIQQSEEIDAMTYSEYFEGDCSDIKITEVPEPKEIIWHDINYPKNKRYFRILLGWFLSAAFVALATVVFYFILVQKAHFITQNIQENKTTAYFLVYFLIIIVLLFNKFVMGYALHFFTHLEKHDSTYKLEASFALKYALGMFFTTALMTLAVEAIKFQNYYSHVYGVIEEETVFFFMNAFFVPLIWLINPFQLFVLMRRKINYGNKFITQAKANHYMQNFHYDMGKRYAEILEMMWFTFLYLTLIPFGSILIFFGLIMYYWVDKFNLLRRSSLHSNMSGKMGLVTMRQLDLTLFFRAIGQLLFDVEIRDGVQAETIVFLSVSIIYMIIPIDKIIDIFNHQDFFIEQKGYTQVKNSFKDTYHSLHPVYNRINKEKVQKRTKRVMNYITESHRCIVSSNSL